MSLKRWKCIWLALLSGALASCTEPLDWSGDGPSARTVYVFSNGWHSDIIVARADLPPDRIPESGDFADKRFVMFGWGDRDYYMTPDPGLWITLKAALWPTPSVMHLVGFDHPPAEMFPDAEIIGLSLSDAAFARLVDHLEQSFKGGGVPLRTGLYDNSSFYEARGRFHLFNTCNRWTARGLKAAGLPVVTFGVITAADVMRQVGTRTGDLGAHPGYSDGVVPVE